jgi:transposase
MATSPPTPAWPRAKPHRATCAAISSRAAGTRRLDVAIHMVALGHVSHPSAGRDYYDCMRAEGKTRREALRALRRQLANVIWRQLVADADAADRAA